MVVCSQLDEVMDVACAWPWRAAAIRIRGNQGDQQEAGHQDVLPHAPGLFASTGARASRQSEDWRAKIEQADGDPGGMLVQQDVKKLIATSGTGSAVRYQGSMLPASRQCRRGTRPV